MKKTILILLIFSALASCTQNSKFSSSEANAVEIKPASIGIEVPLPNVKRALKSFIVNTEKDNEFITEKGSRIFIPKGSLVDENGNTISGKVDLIFEEFHDATDIILSGIPMNITTEDGELGSMESAGMFNISAQQNGSEVRIGNGKTIEIEIASNQEEENFDFFEYDASENNWVNQGNATPRINPDRLALLSETKEELKRPLEIKKASSTDKVFELAVNKKVNPEFASFDNVMWKMADENSDQALFASTLRNPNLQCIDRSKSIFKLTGNVNRKEVEAKVQPVLFGSNWKAAQKKFQAKMAIYKVEHKKQVELRKKANRMGSVRRTMQLAKFGTFNFDRLYHLNRKVQFNALFFIPALKKAFKKGWLIQGKEKVAIPYNRNGYYKFTYDPQVKNTVITFDEEGNLYEFDDEDFEKLASLDLQAEDEYKFEMKKTGVIVDDTEDLTAYLASL